MAETSLNGRNYVLGKGRIYLDRLPNNVEITSTTQGEGERYLGNTPGFSFNTTSESLDHFSAEQGIGEKDDSVQIRVDRNGNISCDNINKENLALWFLGNASVEAQAAATAVTTTRTVKKGHWYKLGQTAANPMGSRLVSSVTAAIGGTAVSNASNVNFIVEASTGRVQIQPNAPGIDDDDVVTFTFDVAASTRNAVVSGSDSIYAALSYIADNPKGVNDNMYVPYLKISPDGDYDIKGEDWQTMNFTFEILTKPGHAAVYIDDQAVSAP